MSHGSSHGSESLSTRRLGRLLFGGVSAVAAWLALLAAAGPEPRTEPQTETASTPLVAFSREVRPILSENCFLCHGPDAGTREAGLRLDVRDAATSALPSGSIAIVPGNPGESALVARITSAGDDSRMPPPETGKSLTRDEIDVLERWIGQGATWQQHWSFRPPVRPDLPEVSAAGWARNPIDRFILARLDQEGLAPSPEAPRTALIRRLALDLTGLPPSLAEVDAFLADDRADAYVALVDRLLDSPRYGEHMARYWLDAARYGDTHGLHLDNERSMWPWRDWVINAFNANMPFDRFTIEQLAGDLLPEPTDDQIIATGFNRNNVTTSEGGAIDAEYLAKYASDRTDTTATVWMGLTLGCAQCHDHKFDPVSQREYYRLFAYFNNVAEQAMDGNRRDPPPIVRAPTADTQDALTALRQRIAACEADLDAPNPAIDAAQVAWRDRWRDKWSNGWEVLDALEFISTSGALLRKLDDGSVLAGEDNPAKDVYEIVARIDGTDSRMLRVEALTDGALPHTGPGRADNANFVLSEIEAEIRSIVDPDRSETIRFAAAAADHQQMNGPYPVAAAIDGIIDETNGWAVEGYNRREPRTAIFVSATPFGFEGGSAITIRLRFETRFSQHTIGRVRLAVAADAELLDVFAPPDLGTWSVVGPFRANDGREAYKLPFEPEQDPGAVDLTATFHEGELAWVPRPELADGSVHDLEGESCATYLHRTIHVPSGRTMEIALGSDDAIKVWLNGRLVHENDVARAAAPDQDRITVDLQSGANSLLLKIVNFTGGYAFYFRPAGEGAGSAFLRLVDLIAAGGELDEEGALRLRRYYRRQHSPPLRALHDRLVALRDEEAKTLSALPITLVMRERDERRATHVLFRGAYDQPRDAVEPGVPAALPPLPDGAEPNRMGLAGRLVEPGHPLTARVTVNRLWQQIFGIGLVRTAGDFGAQGEWPSHPDLLDWLAIELVESGWDVKHVMRLMVTSATYRQSSAVDRALLRRDPENRLLARGPRFRLDAEAIRDQALAASGLLVEKLGGPSVKPYQPVGLWKAVAYPDSNTQVFEPDQGDAQYRRSLYTFWKRTSPPPNLAAFDAPTRETCAVRRPRTNTPLQVLVLLNDRQFVEAARVLAERAWRGAGDDADAAITAAFRLLTAREPDGAELAVLRGLYDDQLAIYEADPEAAAKLLSIGDAPRDETIAIPAHAALTNVATAILSLDEAITKG